MNMRAPHHILFAILGIVALFLVSCGGNEDLAKKLGCPSGTIMANSDDTIVINSPDWTGGFFSAGPSIPYNIDFGGQYSFPYSLNYGPINIAVWEPVGGYRKNNICLVLTTDGFFWDKDFTAFQGEIGVGGRRFVTQTDDSGTATIWWSTGLVNSSATSTGATTAGADSPSYADRISATSGGATPAEWSATYVVRGCQPSTLCP